MRKLKPIFLTFITLLSLSFASAQGGGNPYGDNYGSNNNARTGRRFNRQCTEPFPMRSFNRDYAGISSANYYHLDKTLKEYSRQHCLTAEQIRRLALLYPTDRDKYDFLTYSLTYVFDIENYSLAGAILANRNARDAFYRFLVREGVPAGDYYADPYFAQGGYYNNGYAQIPPPSFRDYTPQYYDRYGNAYNSNAARNSYDNRNNPYDNFGQNSNTNNSYGTNNPNNNPNIDNNNQYGINSGFRGLMTYKEFEILKDRVKQNTFDKGKLETAKTVTRENTLTANQISEITRLFNYDSNRLEYAKFAFDFAYDKENYAAVTDAMAFEVNKKELQRYIENRRK